LHSLLKWLSQLNWYVRNLNYDRTFIINFKLLLEINFQYCLLIFFWRTGSMKNDINTLVNCRDFFQMLYGFLKCNYIMTHLLIYIIRYNVKANQWRSLAFLIKRSTKLNNIIYGISNIFLGLKPISKQIMCTKKRQIINVINQTERVKSSSFFHKYIIFERSGSWYSCNRVESRPYQLLSNRTE